MLERFPDLLPYIAVGVAGSGSEWLGFDDETSRDHDFGPGFTIFLPGEDVVSRRQEFLLERAYAALPDEMDGFKRERMSPVGGNRFGVRRTADFFTEKTGSTDGNLTAERFLKIPEQYLLEATNGAVFYDGSGEFTRIREGLAHLPEDVRLKKLAGELMILGQAAPYNFERCLSHGETGAAELALTEYVQAALHIAFLLNKRYMPFYKWRFRAAKALPELTGTMSPQKLAEALEYLITHENAGEALEKKREILGKVTDALVSAAAGILEREGYLFSVGTRTHTASNPYRMTGIFTEQVTPVRIDDPGRLAEVVNGLISDNELRNMHILSGV